jgi:hypothetical protein
MFRFKKAIKVDVLLDRLHMIKSFNNKGEVQFGLFEYSEIEWTFLSLIEFNQKLSIYSQQKVLFKALKQAALDNVKDEDKFKKILETQLSDHLRIHENVYFLLASLSVDKLPFRKINLLEAEILIKGKRFPKKFEHNRNRLYRKHFNHKEKSDYLKILVKVKGKDIKDAYEKALNNLEIFRAILSLNVNPSFQLYFRGVSYSPINRIRKGYFYSLHFEDGSNVNETLYYYDPKYTEAKLYSIANNEKEILRRNIHWYIKKLNKTDKSQQNRIIEGLKLYVSAFDDRDKYICFLKSWSALEKLAGSDNYDTLIKRCVSLVNEKNKSFEKQILEGLRNYRNRFVHEGEDGLDPAVHCFQVQKYIILLLMVMLKNADLFDNSEQIDYYLDYLTNDKTSLEIRKKLLLLALKEKA